jgi:perosamine synthetase
MDWLPYGRHFIDDDDVAAVVRALRSDWLTTGPEVEAFEHELQAACGARHAVVVSSGTAALHCAYAAAGLGAGDELITTPLTFAAPANMALALGAKVVFADIEEDTMCLDPAAVGRAMTPRAKVIAPVDFAGHPAALGELMALARAKGAIVVEDASHSIGGKLDGKPVGSLAHLTTFSFQGPKNLTTAEGGAVLTDDESLARRARDFRNHGLMRDKARLERDDGPWYYEIQSLGFNHRLSDLHCALGRSQLAKLPRFVARRRQIVARYQAAFAREPRLVLQATRTGAEPAWHLAAIRLKGGAPARAALFAALQKRGLGVQVHNLAVNDFPLYRGLGHTPESTPVAFAASQSILSLPLFSAMSDADVERVIGAVRESLEERS